MRRGLTAFALLAGSVAFGLGMNATAHAASVQSMLGEHGCTACHAKTMKVVGPAWGWVAYRYKTVPHKKAVKAVADFIINGGTGYWSKWTGSIPMPSHPSISMAQAEKIATWVLSQPPIKPPKA